MFTFGTGGFRGIIGDDFTKANVQLAMQALAEIVKEDKSEKPVVIGYDYRFNSDLFAEWAAETLAANGVKALLYSEAMPSPAVIAAVRDEDLDFGVMITASHNPYRFNGLKVFLKSGDADVEFTDRLEKTARAAKEAAEMPLREALKQNLVSYFTNKERYLENILRFIDPAVIEGNHVNVLYDNLCGVGAKCIMPLFEKMKINYLTVLHTEHDAFFANTAPNPTKNAMLSLRERTLSGGYDFAMATDSDSDRLGILDEKGNYVNSNDILAALYYYLLKYRGKKGDVVKNCATSVLLDKLAHKAGFACHEVNVGFKNISAGIRRYDALIGGESSGGLTVRGYIFGKDSVFSSALFTEMVIAMKKPVSEIVKEVHDFAGYSHVFAESEAHFANASEIRNYLRKTPDFGRKVVRTERKFVGNVKYYFENDGWALLRVSGTEPVCRIFAETESAAETERCVHLLENFVSAL